MDSRSLSASQLDDLTRSVERHADYVNRLTKRMRAQDFPSDVKLLCLVVNANGAMQSLLLALKMKRRAMEHGDKQRKRGRRD